MAVRVTKPGLAEPERGTAFYIGSQGLLLTAAHVLRGATRIEFGPNPGGPWQEAHPASVEDLGRDVAIFRSFSPPASGGLEVGVPEAIREDHILYFAGFPFGLAFDRREAKVTAAFGVEGGWQTEGLAAGGFSGGPVINEAGRVVGIITAGVVGTPGFLQITPLSRVRSRLAEQGIQVPFSAGAGTTSTTAPLPAQLRVVTRPDTVGIRPGGFRPVDYVFTTLTPVGVQLETETAQFFLDSGVPASAAVAHSRILGGSFPINGNSSEIYKNNIYLPPEVADLASRNGGFVNLRHTFHLRDNNNNRIDVLAILRVMVQSSP
nr:serine protease [Roseomonas aerilata]